MKATLRKASVFLAHAACVLLLTACDPTISFTTPVNGDNIDSLTVVSGKYNDADEVRLYILRYDDGKFWTGSAWGEGGSAILPTALDGGAKTWQSTGPLPAGANLAPGYYDIIAIAVQGTKQARTDSVVHVGITSPPVTTALFSWGSGFQLGAGPNHASTNYPVPVNQRGALDGKGVVSVAAGLTQTIASTTEGRIYSWSDTPEEVNRSGALAGQFVTGIAAGSGHHYHAITQTLQSAGWGSDNFGELGDGHSGGDPFNPVPPTSPVSTPDLNGKVWQVAAGVDHTVFVTTEGKVFTCGWNWHGRLGVGTDIDMSTVPMPVSGLGSERAVSAASKNDFTLVVTASGKVYGFGANGVGQLGDGSLTDRNAPVQVGTTGDMTGKVITAVAAGSTHSLALDKDGRVYSWGAGYWGQLGNGEEGTTVVHSVPLLVGGALAGKKVLLIAAGLNCSFAVTEDNKVFAWGDNYNGQLAGATPVSTEATVPTEADFSAVFANGRRIQAIDCGSGFGVVLASPAPLPEPEIEVFAQGVELAGGGSISFPSAGVGSSNFIPVTVRNASGGASLLDLSVNVSGDNFSAAFSQPSLEPNGEATFYVRFQPNSTGPLTSTLQIFSNDADENPFDITLTGTAYPVGQVDLPFDPQIDGGPDAISVQPDGKVVVGGSFLNFGPVARNRCARLDATTGAADSFDPNVDNFISCSLVLPDGKVMIGGGFTSVGGVARNKLARLNADGTLDTDYNAQIGGSFGVTGMALQRDGKLIIVGNITSVAGVGVTFAARLNPDGTRDSSFAPILNAPPRGVAVRGDGQVLIWGQFTIANGDAYSRIALLNGVDGSTDRSFLNPLIAISGSQIDVAALQPDTKILVGGNVQSVDGTTIHGMCRLNSDGTLDAGFNPDVDGQVNSIALQADGSMIFSGLFTHVSGQPRDRIAKIAANGSLDFYFNPGSGNAMNAVMLQADGKLLCTPGGTIAGESRLGIARLSNGVATQSLTMTNNGATIEWLRDGTAPETNLVTFDVSTDGGTTWSPVGAASRVAYPSRGWVLTDGGLPPTGHIRARAYAQGARYNGSSSIMETIAAYGTPPDITVTEAPYSYSSGNTRLFGVVATGSGSAVMQLAIQNVGGSVITGLSGATIEDNNLSDDKDHRSMFQLTKPSSSSLAPGATANLSLTYLPKTTGRHTAVLRIPSNDPDENPFSITISGQGSEPFTTYKERLAGDTALPDATITHFKSGQSLLSAYATGTTDSSTDGDGTSITPPTGGGSGFAPASFFGQSPAPSPGGGVFFFNYRRNKLALADVIYQVEWSDTLAPNDWHTDDVTEEITSDDDSIQRVQATVPAGTAGHRFVRLRMTRL